MAGFLMWIANFFSMEIFWKYMCFARNNEGFLYIKSEHYNSLSNVISRLEKCSKDMEASSKNKVLNKNQCAHLLGKLILAMKGIDKMFSTTLEDLKFQSIFEELDCLQRKVEILVQNCTTQEQWCHWVVFQLQNKETFRELLLDLKCCYDASHDLYLSHHPNQSNNILPIQFDAATYDQILEDGQELKKKLELVSQGEVSQDYNLAQHLLLRLRNLDRVDGGKLDDLEVLNDFKTPKFINKIGAGSYGCVFKSNWLGLTCATKVLKGDSSFLINSRHGANTLEGNSSILITSRKEAGILAGLSHPNLVQFFGCGINKNSHENVGEVETGEMYLVMELMETSLSSMLKNSSHPLPYHVAIDIMYQIAKGVYYLHDMQVAHLDLKPDNVLSSPISKEDPCCIFKVTDYGTSQLEVCSNPKDPKPSEYIIGTRGYMSPEVIKGSTTPLYPFQADVWSFAMICSEILSKKVPYSGVKAKDFYDQISHIQGTGNRNFRPDLPNNCEELTNLIQECWSQDPLQRPTFSQICERLTNLKKSFLKGTYSCEMVPQFGSPCTLRISKSIVDPVPKVDEKITLVEEVLVDFDHQLAKVKGLLNLNYVGIVGMGGIGKTTLAKAIFDDVTMSSSYHGSCFVAQCKDYQSSYDILCKILPKLGKNKKPMNLGDAQEMTKELLVEKKVLLILDDIKNDSQVCDIVPPDIIQASKGTTVILTTRDWSTIQSYVGFDGKLDVGLLNEKVATTLFTTHLSWGVVALSPDFENLRKHVVKACNGLPLSLKVMGAFLHGKERLRSWERALQRMARGRNLDGDEEIWNTLQISFDGLTKDVEKRMFLDVACFFCRDVYPLGISRKTILYMWSKDGILPKDELQRLIDMSLLKVNEDGDILEMHDQLRDMGRNFAKNTRIWKASMIPESGFSSKDVEVLEGISLQGTMNHHGLLLKHDKIFDFKKLRVLILRSTSNNFKAHFDNLDLLLQLASQCSKLEAIILENFEEIFLLSSILSTNTKNNLHKRISNLFGTSASLKILDLKGLIFLKNLPNRFASSNILLRLDLSFCDALATLPKEVGNLSSLTTLNFEGCRKLVSLPKEVGNLSSLTTLNLKKCSKLVSLPKEVGNLSSLTTLDLRGCSKLVSLPKEVGNLSSLTTLNLWGCSKLVSLPKEVGNLSSLTTLNFEGCSKLVSLPKEVGNLSSLTTLDLRGCSKLVSLPKEVGNLSSLTTLDLRGCSKLVSLPKEVGNLSSLTTIKLGGCSKLVSLPKEVGNLSSLTTLDLRGCSKLVSLPKEVGNLSSLTTLNLWGCSKLVSLPKEVGNLSSLTTLHLLECSSLVSLPKEVGNLSSLTTLNLRGCSKLVSLPKEVGNLSSLTTLYLFGCSKLVSLPKEVGNLASMTTLDLEGYSKLASLPKEVGNLSSLTTIKLGGCSKLVSLPKEVGNLSSLTTLDLRVCSNMVSLPKEVGNLSSLTTLDLGGCLKLVSLPKEVGNLSSLTTLDLGGCLKLVSLPKEVGNLSSLTTLDLRGCSKLVSLPKEVGNLSSLTTLNLGGCSNMVSLPKEVGNLSSLTTLDLEGCSKLAALRRK